MAEGTTSDWSVWALAWAAAGWVAAQVTAVARDFLYRWWMKRAINNEVSQLYEETERLWRSYARSLQTYAVGGIDGAAPLPLSNFIFANYYKDAALVFNRQQRIALQLIHGYIGTLNEGATSLTSLTRDIQPKAAELGHCPPGLGDVYGRRLKELLLQVDLLRWHIHHYLTHPIFPELDVDGPTHRDYLDFLAKSEQHMEGLIAWAKEHLTLEDFTKPPGSPSGSSHTPFPSVPGG